MSGLLVVLIRINPKGPNSKATFELLSNDTSVKDLSVYCFYDLVYFIAPIKNKYNLTFMQHL